MRETLMQLPGKQPMEEWDSSQIS